MLYFLSVPESISGDTNLFDDGTGILLLSIASMYYRSLQECFAGIAGIPAILMGTVIYYLCNDGLQQAVNTACRQEQHMGRSTAWSQQERSIIRNLLAVFCEYSVWSTALDNSDSARNGASSAWLGSISILAGGAAYVICIVCRWIFGKQ